MDELPENGAAKTAAKEEARRKLVGRAFVIGFVVLIAIYAAATFWGRR